MYSSPEKNSDRKVNNISSVSLFNEALLLLSKSLDSKISSDSMETGEKITEKDSKIGHLLPNDLFHKINNSSPCERKNKRKETHISNRGHFFPSEELDEEENLWEKTNNSGETFCSTRDNFDYSNGNKVMDTTTEEGRKVLLHKEPKECKEENEASKQATVEANLKLVVDEEDGKSKLKFKKKVKKSSAGAESKPVSSPKKSEVINNNYKLEEYIIEMFGKLGWICVYCNNFNYLTRTACNRCNKTKLAKKILVPQNNIKNTCNNNSKQKNSKVNINLSPKSNNTSNALLHYLKDINNSNELKNLQAKLRSINFSQLSSNKQKAVIYGKKGDWVCFNCMNVNFSFRDYCNRCSLPKSTTDFITSMNHPY